MALFELSERLKKLPPYLFKEIRRKHRAAIEEGRDIIDLGIGDPDTPTPQFVIDALCSSARNPRTHQYPMGEGDPRFRRKVAEFMEARYGVPLDADSEIAPIIGSKEAIANLPLAFINPGDVALVPEPGYPPYRSGPVFSGGEVVTMPLLPERNFMPDLDAIPEDTLERAKMVYLNYPNSPTGVLATRELFERVVALCREHGIVLVQDAAYIELVYDDRATSVLEIEGAREVAIEFHSLSKTFNMTGWRVGWACGGPEVISALLTVKSNLDSGVFTAIQQAAVAALEGFDSFVPGLVEMYGRRRDTFCSGLKRLGWKVRPPQATFYLWLPVPDGYSSMDTAARLLDEADVVVTPGNGLGESGEGFIRATLLVSEERLTEAVERISKLKW